MNLYAVSNGYNSRPIKKILEMNERPLEEVVASIAMASNMTDDIIRKGAEEANSSMGQQATDMNSSDGTIQPGAGVEMEFDNKEESSQQRKADGGPSRLPANGRAPEAEKAKKAIPVKRLQNPRSQQPKPAKPVTSAPKKRKSNKQEEYDHVLESSKKEVLCRIYPDGANKFELCPTIRDSIRARFPDTYKEARVSNNSPFAQAAAAEIAEAGYVEEGAFLEATAPKKRVRKKVAQVIQEKGLENVTRDVPEEERLSDQELVDLGLQLYKEKRVKRWTAASYCWNKRGRLYECYWKLADMVDPKTSLPYWPDEVLEKFLASESLTAFNARRALLGLLGKNGVRKRAPKTTEVQRTSLGTFAALDKNNADRQKVTNITKRTILHNELITRNGEQVSERLKAPRDAVYQNAEIVNTSVVAIHAYQGEIRKAVNDVNKDIMASYTKQTDELNALKSEHKIEIDGLTEKLSQCDLWQKYTVSKMKRMAASKKIRNLKKRLTRGQREVRVLKQKQYGSPKLASTISCSVPQNSLELFAQVEITSQPYQPTTFQNIT